MKRQGKIQLFENYIFLHLKKNNHIGLLPIFVLACLVFSNLISNELLISWTDQAYIIYNKDIQQLSFENLQKIFTTFFMDNYHPLTNLSNAIEYHFWGLDPRPYHLNNLIIHLLNTALIYHLFLMFNKNIVSAIIAALVFIIHPMHVESVAWASERKDMLYTFFYLLSIITYIYSFQKKNRDLYYLSLGMFLLSLLSKSAAVSLAPVIVLIDVIYHRKYTKNIILEKVPYFALSMFFGILALISQKASGAMDLAPHFPVYDRIFLTSYVVIFYIFKFFFPIKLSAFHPYPLKMEGVLPIEYYLSFLAILAILLIIFKFKSLRKTLIIGLLLYAIPISLVLQIIPAGRTIVSERFSYVSYLGLIYLLTHFVAITPIKYKRYFYLIFSIYISIFCFISFNRVKVWKDSFILYSDVTKKYPKSDYAFWTKANSQYLKAEYAGALKDYFHTLDLNPNFDDAYLKIGNIYFKTDKPDSALKYYELAIKINPKNDQAYNNLALSWSNLKKDSVALNYYCKAIEANPKYISAFIERGNIYMKFKNYSFALKDFISAMNLSPNNPEIYGRIGLCKFEMGNFNEALKDFSTSLNINQNAYIYILRGITYHKLKHYNDAISDFSQSLQLEPNSGLALFHRANSKYELKWKTEACEDWKKSYYFHFADAAIMLKNYCQ